MESSRQYKENQIRKLISYAKAIVSNDLSTPVAIIEIDKLIDYENPEGFLKDIDIDIFKLVASELDTYPTGNQRSLWNEQRLRVKDKEIEQIIDFHKVQLLDSSSKIIDAFENQDKLRAT